MDRIESEELRHDQNQILLNAQPHNVKCLECGDMFLAEEMECILEHFDTEGLCQGCALIDDNKSAWGLI